MFKDYSDICLRVQKVNMLTSAYQQFVLSQRFSRPDHTEIDLNFLFPSRKNDEDENDRNQDDELLANK